MTDIEIRRANVRDAAEATFDAHRAVDITAVMADGSLSFTAKNVKIITQNGKVTLRGPVNSADERNAIVRRATTTSPELRDRVRAIVEQVRTGGEITFKQQVILSPEQKRIPDKYGVSFTELHAMAGERDEEAGKEGAGHSIRHWNVVVLIIAASRTFDPSS